MLQDLQISKINNHKTYMGMCEALGYLWTVASKLLDISILCEILQEEESADFIAAGKIQKGTENKLQSERCELLNFLWYTRVCVRVWSGKYISVRREGRNEGIKWWLVEGERCPWVKKTPPLLQAQILLHPFDVWYPYPRKKLSGLYHGYVHGCWTFQAALSQGST